MEGAIVGSGDGDGGGFANALDDHGNGAALFVAVDDGERDALAAVGRTDDDELAGLPPFGDARRFYFKQGRSGVSCCLRIILFMLALLRTPVPSVP